MQLWENISLAITGLRANKMRSFLTMLGIIIGIAAVITIMTLGDTVSAAVSDSMQSLGANNITVTLQQKPDEDTDESGQAYTWYYSTKAPEEADYITDAMINSYLQAFPEEIYAVSIAESLGDGKVEKGKLYANVAVMGVNSGYFITSDLDMLAGRNLSVRDYQEGKRVAVVSDKLVNNLYDGDTQAALGQQIEAVLGDAYYSYTIVGVYEYVQNAMMYYMGPERDITTTVYIPAKTARDQLHSTAGFQSFSVVTNTGVDSTAFSAKTERFFNSYYRKNNDFKITAFSMESMMSELTAMMSTIELAISIIAGISLLVGGIGVMNIMLVSITERTREIGTCKALGATNGSIRMQFITEAIIICLIGGLFGVILGVSMGMVGAGLLGYTAKAAADSIVIALLFSMTIGVFFGYYPANKAARMDPIEALRYE